MEKVCDGSVGYQWPLMLFMMMMMIMILNLKYVHYIFVTSENCSDSLCGPEKILINDRCNIV